jgi:hypothetical protein
MLFSGASVTEARLLAGTTKRHPHEHHAVLPRSDSSAFRRLPQVGQMKRMYSTIGSDQCVERGGLSSSEHGRASAETLGRLSGPPARGATEIFWE